MPRKATITKEQVFEAADKIWAANKTPTKERVREMLGNGSFATIHSFLQEWRSLQVDTSKISDFAELPDEVRTLASRFYSIAVQTVQEASITEQVEILERENQELREKLTDYQKLEGKLRGMQIAYDALLEKYSTVCKQNQLLSESKNEAQLIQEPQPISELPQPQLLNTQEPEIIQPETVEQSDFTFAKPYTSLPSKELAKRLNCHLQTLTKNRKKDDFSQWSKSRDPEGCTWYYSETQFCYVTNDLFTKKHEVKFKQSGINNFLEDAKEIVNGKN